LQSETDLLKNIRGATYRSLYGQLDLLIGDELDGVKWKVSKEERTVALYSFKMEEKSVGNNRETEDKRGT
jgi:hypothetical protein